MIRMPRRRPASVVIGHSTFCTCSRIWSIDGLELEADRRQLARPRLRAERVGLAVELLHQEVEPAPDRAALGDQRSRRGDVRLQPVELLGDVGLHRDQRQLLGEPGLVDRRRRRQHRLEPAPHQLSGAGGAALGRLARRRHQPADPLELGFDGRGERRPLGGATGREGGHDRSDVRAHRRQHPGRLRRRRRLRLHHAAQRQEVRRRHRREVEPGPGRRLLGGARGRDRRRQRLGPQPRNRRAGRARDPERHRHRPARQRRRRRLPQRRVERFEPLGKPQPRSRPRPLTLRASQVQAMASVVLGWSA